MASLSTAFLVAAVSVIAGTTGASSGTVIHRLKSVEIVGQRLDPYRKERAVRTFVSTDSFAEYAEGHVLAREEFRADSTELLASWEWIGTVTAMSSGPERALDQHPRFLQFRADGTYMLSEIHLPSLAVDTLCSGRFLLYPSVHGKIEGAPRPVMWIELDGWCGGKDNCRQQISFLDRNTIVTYPGYEGSDFVVTADDAPKTRYRRVGSYGTRMDQW